MLIKADNGIDYDDGRSALWIVGLTIRKSRGALSDLKNLVRGRVDDDGAGRARTSLTSPIRQVKKT